MARKFFDIRTSQVITNYGVGGMVPMGDKGSVMVTSLGTWNVDLSNDLTIRDHRLEQQLGVEGFVPPPTGKNEGKDIPVKRFPLMVSCPGCRILQAFSKFNIAEAENECTDCGKSLVPSRFVVVCKKGHIDDFPYSSWIHEETRQVGDCSGILEITNSSKTATLSAISISCKSCGTKRSMDGAFNPSQTKNVVKCTGKTPWIPRSSPSLCNSPVQVLQRGAASVWAPSIKSALSIPPWSEQIFSDIPQRDLEQIESNLKEDPNFFPDKRGWLKAYLGEKRYVASSERSLEEFVDLLMGTFGPDSLEDLSTDLTMRADEYKAIEKGKSGDRNQKFISEGPVTLGNYSRAKIDKLMRLPVLTEVRVLTGFKRAGATTQDTVDIKQSLTWLPAVEIKGEGIFMSFPEQKLKLWESKSDVTQNFHSIENNIPPNREIPVTPRFVLLHSIAHILMKQLAMDSGYPITSLKERIYSGEDMAGILIYTNGGDSAGSLGGLISLSSPDKLDVIFERALTSVNWCSHDPLCIDSASGVDSVNWGACQACLLIPEPSCEEMNSFLDRRPLKQDSPVTFFRSPTD